MTQMIKIAETNIQKYGTRGFATSIPAIYINDNNLSTGESLQWFRTYLNGEDVLIIKKLKNTIDTNDINKK